MKCQKVDRILLKTVKKARPRHNPFSGTSRSFPISRHDHYAPALEACEAAVRTAQLTPPGSFFRFLPRLSGKTILSASHSGQLSISLGLKVVSTVLNEIG